MKAAITWECGETTCAIEPGRLCQWCRVKSFGTIWICHLFEVRLEEREGWLMRYRKCLACDVPRVEERTCGTCGHWAPCANNLLGLCGYTQGLTQAQDHACADDNWTPRDGQEGER